MTFSPARFGTALAALTMAAGAGGPAQAGLSFDLNLYGNIGLAVQKEGEQPVAGSFQAPQFDLFFVGSRDRLSLISEVLFDIDEGNTFTVDIDRLQLGYLWRRWLRITAGKFHTAIGYYNTAYPHGAAYYELPIDRPVLVSSLNRESLLPTLGIGVRADGQLSLGAAGFFHYDVEVMNGRGVNPDEATNVLDHNLAKSINVRLRYEPAFLDGLIIGGNVYFDRIPGSAVQPVAMDEQIFGAHLAYVESPWHLILEGAVIRHLGDDGSRYHTLVGLGQFGYSFGDLTPYLRLEVVRFPSFGDPFFLLGGSASRGSFTAVSGGLKWTVSSALALKLELEIDHSVADDVRSVVTQAAFTF
jgi:hypothetical protein